MTELGQNGNGWLQVALKNAAGVKLPQHHSQSGMQDDNEFPPQSTISNSNFSSQQQFNQFPTSYSPTIAFLEQSYASPRPGLAPSPYNRQQLEYSLPMVSQINISPKVQNRIIFPQTTEEAQFEILFQDNLENG
ncbi:MAG: hypothetical protein EZS28_019972 [Streblomastix strix]|uniref:Uncharacterized protein n=1 Tax=Streblomastix strix TaxID=222440 RepID=A0A5J4VPI6_9EUKA|nr:MAG: hypothetical protein EZS28_019972 [Streblomastix strix]